MSHTGITVCSTTVDPGTVILEVEVLFNPLTPARARALAAELLAAAEQAEAGTMTAEQEYAEVLTRG